MRTNHPFTGGRNTKGYTRKHKPLIWECMLGTVFAMNAAKRVKYFDYDYAAARAYAGVDACTDLRVCRTAGDYQWTDGTVYGESGPRNKQLALFGVRP